MKKITLETSKPVVPMIYAYTTPEVKRHDGWTKIGYTEQDVDTRIAQQTHTADVLVHKEWQGTAIYDDGTGDTFLDKDFHRYLRKLGVKQEEGKNNEWFEITGPDSRNHFFDFKQNRGILAALGTTIPYTLRKEQADAVDKTIAYMQDHPNAEFLWNAKPRFGKTLTVYDFCKKIKAKQVLIVTNRPAIANSWYSDYVQFLGAESGYCFVSDTDSLKGKAFVVSRADYLSGLVEEKYSGCIEFVSLQDLKGALEFGGKFDKLTHIAENDWDVLVIDEAHEGVDTTKTDVAFDHIKRKFTLHLSGTPFKALANDKFPDRAIYNWTYADEQSAKRDWDDSSEEENPYKNLPKLNLFTYQMSEIIKDLLSQGIEINGETEEYAFDLNEFFAVKDGRFIHEDAVDEFLDALTKQEKFPFSTPELRNEIKHSFWLLNRVASAKALAAKLAEHDIFKDYKVVLAAGDGKMDDDTIFESEATDNNANKKSYDKVVQAIKENDKTITLSVGQLTTGVTIPEWTAVLMLSNVKSPALYMQAAFRAQNPCLFHEGTKSYRKENAYVFDFDPARTLTIFEEFANDLSAHTVNGRGDVETRKRNIRELLNFFPVIGEDENGEMIALDAEKVLSIPRKIRSVEVVKRGFMSNYLFNIGRVFGTPMVDILNKLEATKQPKVLVNTDEEETKDLYQDDEGNINVPEEVVIGQAQNIFGDKVYGDDTSYIIDIVDNIEVHEDTFADKLKKAFTDNIIVPTIEAAKDSYGREMKPSDKNAIERDLKKQAESFVSKSFGNYEIEKNKIEKARNDAIASSSSEEEVKDINQKFDALQKEQDDSFKDLLSGFVSDFKEEAQKKTVETVETNKRVRQLSNEEETMRDHLRGFSRTIPSFLMAYGTEDEDGNPNVSLASFDSIVPGEVFIEVTSITLDEFKTLRDGGTFTNDQGEEVTFPGCFDEIVFDDSVKEFMDLKERLANYFDENAKEDIFDYVPPQKTNQIFTPKAIVKKMVDMLEEENPGCFDEPEKTFLDPYMKSGLYITEIVKRLYQSPKMKERFPDDTKRLKHIFAHQVYGLAPTEIIYEIAKNYILGFSEDIPIEKHNIRLGDSLPHAKAGDFEQWLDKVFK